MRHLKRLGFIDCKPGTGHDFQWVLVLNPHHVVQRLGGKVQERYRAAWRDRAIEVGAKDLGPLPEAPKKEPNQVLIPKPKPATKKMTSKKSKS